MFVSISCFSTQKQNMLNIYIDSNSQDKTKVTKCF